MTEGDSNTPARVVNGFNDDRSRSGSVQSDTTRSLATPTDQRVARARQVEARHNPRPSRESTRDLANRRAALVGTATRASVTSPAVRSVAVRGARRTASGVWRVFAGFGWLARKIFPIDQPLLRDPIFRSFWFSRLLVQTAQGAMLYALLIVVADRTDLSFFTAVWVACSIIPSIFFGIPGGIVVDSLPRRPLMIGLNLVRFMVIAAVLFSEPSLPGIFALTLAIWVIHQFYSPLESSIVAALVPQKEYANAQALHNLALTIAQALGLVVIAPLVLRVFGPQVLFAVCAALFFTAAALAMLLPRMDDHLKPATTPDQTATGKISKLTVLSTTGGMPGIPTQTGTKAPGRPPRSMRSFGAARDALLGGWRMVRSDRITFGAVMDDLLVGIGLSSLLVIMPVYLEQVLGTAKENTTFVFAPAALGLVIGLRVAPKLGLAIGHQRAATWGLVLFATVLFGFGFVVQLRETLEFQLGIPLRAMSDAIGVQTLVLVAMLLSIPAGLAASIVGVAGRSVMLSRTPSSARGQVIATQNLISNVAALIPTLLTGLAADLLGVEPIAIAIALVIVAGAIIAHTVANRPAPLPAPAS